MLLDRFARHRRLVAFISPGVIAHIIWWTYAATHPSTFDLFTDVTADTPNWYMCVTMAFGSMVAGATSEVNLRGVWDKGEHVFCKEHTRVPRVPAVDCALSGKMGTINTTFSVTRCVRTARLIVVSVLNRP